MPFYNGPCHTAIVGHFDHDKAAHRGLFLRESGCRIRSLCDAVHKRGEFQVILCLVDRSFVKPDADTQRVVIPGRGTFAGPWPGAFPNREGVPKENAEITMD